MHVQYDQHSYVFHKVAHKFAYMAKWNILGLFIIISYFDNWHIKCFSKKNVYNMIDIPMFSTNLCINLHIAKGPFINHNIFKKS